MTALAVAIEINYEVIGVYSRVSVACGGLLTLVVKSHRLTDFAASFAVFLVYRFWDRAEARILPVQRLLPVDLSIAIYSKHFLIELSVDRFANARVQVVAVYRAHARLQ